MIKDGPLFAGLSRPTARRRLQEAFATAQALKLIGPKRQCSNHTLRHSAARHWAGQRHPHQRGAQLAGPLKTDKHHGLPGTVSDPGDLISQVR